MSDAGENVAYVLTRLAVLCTGVSILNRLREMRTSASATEEESKHDDENNNEELASVGATNKNTNILPNYLDETAEDAAFASTNLNSKDDNISEGGSAGSPEKVGNENESTNFLESLEVTGKVETSSSTECVDTTREESATGGQVSDDNDKQECHQETLVTKKEVSNEDIMDTGDSSTLSKFQDDFRQSEVKTVDKFQEADAMQSICDNRPEYFSSTSVLSLDDSGKEKNKGFTTFPKYQEEQDAIVSCPSRDSDDSMAMVESIPNASALEQEAFNEKPSPNAAVEIVQIPTTHSYRIESTEKGGISQTTNQEAYSVIGMQEKVLESFHSPESDEFSVDSLDEDDKSQLSSSLTSVTSFSSSCSACANKLLDSDLKNKSMLLTSDQANKVITDAQDWSSKDLLDDEKKKSFSAPEILVSDRVLQGTEGSVSTGLKIGDATHNFLTLTPTVSSSSFEYVDGAEMTENKKRKQQGISALPMHVRFLSNEFHTHLDSLPKSPWPGKRTESLEKRSSNSLKAAPLAANTAVNNGPKDDIEHATKTEENDNAQPNKTHMKNTTESASSAVVKRHELSSDNKEERRNKKQSASQKMSTAYIVSYVMQGASGGRENTAVAMMRLNFESNSRARDAIGCLKVCVENCEGLVDQKLKKPAYYMKIAILNSNGKPSRHRAKSSSGKIVVDRVIWNADLVLNSVPSLLLSEGILKVTAWKRESFSDKCIASAEISLSKQMRFGEDDSAVATTAEWLTVRRQPVHAKINLV